jgi:hypothetical protein
MQNVAPVTLGGVDDAPQKQEAIAGLAKLWRSLINSCMGNTMFPYCRYIRTLDLHDLASLLEEVLFRTEYHKAFFSKPLAEFRIELDGPPPAKQAKGRGKRPIRLDAPAIARRVGDLLTKQATMLEELAGDIESASLIEWLPRLRHLRYLRLWSGLEAKNVGPVIRQNCPSFHHFTFYHARADEADACLSEFLSQLGPNSLQSYMVASHSDANTTIFPAFNHHAESLTSLKLVDLSGEGLINLSNMSACTNLRTLFIHLRNAPPLTATESSSSLPIPGLTSWLGNCQHLTDISFKSTFDSDELFLKLLTPLLLGSGLHITSLSVHGYSAPSLTSTHSIAFYSNLPAQSQYLRSLDLRADGEMVDTDVLTRYLAQLPNLTDLRLQNISDYFQNRHIIAIATNMPLLEDLWISGWSITDGIWDSLADLTYLRRLEISAFSHFTFEGVLSFLQRLDDTLQRTFYLSIMMADPTSMLAKDEEAQNMLRLEMARRVEGRFEYTLARGTSRCS